ncbi:hypothetical protein [Peribacillus muralis]|uniref:hypothetical protein n=1 Tax=Peribacillus muralis TaxID=264697 RepID=UPI003CFF86EC
MLEITKKIMRNKVKEDDTFINCYIAYDTKQIYSITVYNNDDCVDFKTDYLKVLNQYPIYINLEIDEYMYDDIIKLCVKNKISFEENVDKYNNVHFELIIKNDREFHTIYDYFTISATNNLTNMYSFKENLIKKNWLSENDPQLKYYAMLSEGDILIGLGNDSSILEIWTTDRKIFDFF